MRNIFNFFGWLLLLVAIAIGARELYDYLDRGRHALATVQDVWVQYAPASFSSVQASLTGLPLPAFWDGLFRTLVVGMPAMVLSFILAVVLLLAARLGRVEDTSARLASRRARRRRSSSRLS